MKFKTLAFLLIFTFMADAGIGMLPMPYPVEVFSEDTTFPVQKVIDGDTVEIQYEGKTHKSQTHRSGYARDSTSPQACPSVRQRSICIHPESSDG